MTATDITAWLALILAVISLYWQWIAKRPRLDIRPRIREGSLSALSGENKRVPMLSVYLSNPGEKPIHVRDVWFIPNRGREIQIFEYNAMAPRLSRPFTIDPLRGHEFLVRGQQLAGDLQARGYEGEIQAFIRVNDEIGRHYKSKVIRFSIAQLLEA